jgi:hypothetical protein
MATDFMILLTRKFSASYKNRSAENTQIPSLWPFFMGSHLSTHDSGIKRASYYSFKKLVRPRLDQRSNAVECNNGNALRNAVVVHTFCMCYVTLFCCVKVMFRHVMMRGEWSVIHLTGLLTKP